MGDCNIDSFDKGRPGHNKLLGLIQRLGLRQVIKKTTRPSLNRNSCIDLIISNSDSIENIGVLDINLSDHWPVICSFKQLKCQKRNAHLLIEVIEIMMLIDFNNRYKRPTEMSMIIVTR